MLGTIRQYLTKLGSGSDREALNTVLTSATHAARTATLASAGLVIKTGGSTLAKTGATAWYGLTSGRLITIAAGTDMPALTGIVIPANQFNVVCFFVNNAGTVNAVAGTAATTIGGVVFPDFALGQTLVGFLLITHSSTFTGGTTPLDTATTVYFSPLGALDPTIIVS